MLSIFLHEGLHFHPHGSEVVLLGLGLIVVLGVGWLVLTRDRP